MQEFRIQCEAGIEIFKPIRLPGCEDAMGEQAARAGFFVDLFARVRHLLVGQEPIPLGVGRRGRDQRDLGVAVEKHLLFIVVELQILDRLLVVGKLLVPAGLAHRLAHLDEAHDTGVVAQEMRVHVHDELVLERVRSLLGHRRRRCFRLGHLEQRSIDLVHGDKGCGHASRSLEKSATIQALLAAEVVGHGQHPRLGLALPLVLRIGIKFVAGNNLGWNRRLVLKHFGRHQRSKFFFC